MILLVSHFLRKEYLEYSNFQRKAVDLSRKFGPKNTLQKRNDILFDTTVSIILMSKTRNLQVTQ